MLAGKPILSWGKQRLSRLSVAKKIGYGYGLAISIAFLGTGIGLIIGDYSQRIAQEKLQVAEAQDRLISKLTIATLSVRAHPQRLLAVLQDSIWFSYETSKFTNDVNEINQLLVELKDFTDRYPTQLAVEPQQLQELINTYTQVTRTNVELIKALWQQVDPQNLSPQQTAESPQRVLAVLTEAETARSHIEFDRLSESLTRMQQATTQQQIRAYEQLNQASAFRLNTILTSMVLSGTIAIVLAILTSRAIAQPVQTLTQIAQRSIQDSDFGLQAPVTSNDEIGILSHSFNQLIDSVKTLLQQQQEANEQLEQKVEERTQELSDKNHHLKQLLQELQQTQSQLVQQEKMSSLGQLVAGVAHEINNPINFIHGNLTHVQQYSQDLLETVQLYQKHYPNPVAEIQVQAEELDLEFVQDDLTKILGSMKIGTDRICRIVLSLRNFSRMDEADFKAVDIHEGIDSTLMILQHRLKATGSRPEIEVIRDYSKIPQVECFAGQLNQVFMNILANAIDALDELNANRSYQDIKDELSRITIRTSTLNPHWVEIVIADNGPGMPDSVRQCIFNPFFTTKPIGKGTGMGMAISHQIITEKHNGKLECFSTPGQGTEFFIRIPIQQNCVWSIGDRDGSSRETFSRDVNQCATKVRNEI